MSARLDLGPDERDELARLLAGASLHALLRDWAAFVSAVERGYDDSIYDYTNDLSARDALERVIAPAGPSLRAALEAVVTPDDRRFEAATTESARPLGEGRPNWWWRRVPRRPSAELADDLASLGYLR